MYFLFYFILCPKTNLAIPFDGPGVYLQTLRVGLPALLVVVQIQQAEVVGVFLTLEAGCLLQEQHHCPPLRKLLERKGTEW